MVAGLTGDNFVNEIGTLWFVQARNTTGTPSVVNTVSVISYARVPRIEINSDPTVTFLEVTVTAQKDFLDNFMLEYDEEILIKLDTYIIANLTQKPQDQFHSVKSLTTTKPLHQ